MLFNHLILCHPLFLLPSVFLSIKVFFQWVSSLHQLAKSIGASALASSLLVNIHGWFPLRLTGLVSWQSKGLSRIFSSTTIWKHQFFSGQPFLWSKSHIHTWLPEKPWLWPYRPLLAKWCLWFLNTLSRFVIDFLPRSKCLLISWLKSPSAVILEPKKIKSLIASIFSPSVCYEVMGLAAMILVFWMLSFKPSFSFSSYTLIRKLFSSSSLSAIRMVSKYLAVNNPTCYRLNCFLKKIRWNPNTQFLWIWL